MNSEGNNINICNVNLDVFYNILISMNDLSKAVKWIRICKREDQFQDNSGIARLFCDYYKKYIMSLYYSDMVNLFANNMKIFSILYNDEAFWISKILYDMKHKKLKHLENDIDEFFSESCCRYTIYVYIMLNYWQINIEYDGNLPLRNAIMCGNLPIIKLLLDEYVDLVEFNNDIRNKYAIIVFIRDNGGDIKILKWMIEDGRIYIPNDVILTAAEKERDDIIKLLLEKTNINPSYDYNEVIRLSSEKGYDKIVELLLKDSRVDPSAGVRPGLQAYNVAPEFVSLRGTDYSIRIASKQGHYKVVKLLLSDPGRAGLSRAQRVDPTANDNEAIKFAIKNNHVNVIKLLLNDKRVLNSVSINDLKDISRNNIQIIIYEILKRRTDINKIYKKLINKKAKKIFEYWEDFIGRSEDDELNAETISQKFQVKQENNIIHVSAKLEEFSEIYRKEIRGYLLVNYKGMIVIFQSFPKSDVSIIKIEL